MTEDEEIEKVLKEIRALADERDKDIRRSALILTAVDTVAILAVVALVLLISVEFAPLFR